MKILYIMSIALLAPTLSLADYIPGRVRATAEAQMQAISGDGKFENVKSASLVEMSTDGERITHYELILDGTSHVFTVSKASNGNCGDFYEAGTRNEIKLILRDMSFAKCEFRAKYKWDAQVVQTENGIDSHLTISGDPEHLLVTQ